MNTIKIKFIRLNNLWRYSFYLIILNGLKFVFFYNS